MARPVNPDFDLFMGIALLVARRSKDPVTKVGACIVKNDRVISVGYNGMPNKCEGKFPWGKGTNAQSVDSKLMYENLAPSELKKLRNKLRKARRKAEQESAQAAQAQVKREQHNKSRQQGDVEPDAPQLDELIPDKLARVEDPLEQAIRFLKPLQTLASQQIETHLMAFEIFFRKEKTLLMLQSIKRAYRLDHENCKLHSCLVRFADYITRVREKMPSAVRDVVDKEARPMFDGRGPKELNDNFLQKNSKCLEAIFQGGKMLYYLDHSAQTSALSLVTKFSEDLKDVSLEIYTRILQSLRGGDFGSCEAVTEEFVKKCHARFQYATAFRPPSTTPPTSNSGPCENNHVTPVKEQSKENCHGGN